MVKGQCYRASGVVLMERPRGLIKVNEPDLKPVEVNDLKSYPFSASKNDHVAIIEVQAALGVTSSTGAPSLVCVRPLPLCSDGGLIKSLTVNYMESRLHHENTVDERQRTSCP